MVYKFKSYIICRKCKQAFHPLGFPNHRANCDGTIKNRGIANYRRRMGDYDHGGSPKGMTAYRKSVGDENG